MIGLLEENALLLLFLVMAIGYWIGRVSFRGSSMGVAAVLFVGLAFGLFAKFFYCLLLLSRKKKTGSTGNTEVF